MKKILFLVNLNHKNKSKWGGKGQLMYLVCTPHSCKKNFPILRPFHSFIEEKEGEKQEREEGEEREEKEGEEET